VITCSCSTTHDRQGENRLPFVPVPDQQTHACETKHPSEALGHARPSDTKGCRQFQEGSPVAWEPVTIIIIILKFHAWDYIYRWINANPCLLGPFGLKLPPTITKHVHLRGVRGVLASPTSEKFTSSTALQ
jgi:hypothetical protein